MLVNDYRPMGFRDIVGQPMPVSILRDASRNPDEAPRCWILHGPHGTGKTSLARVFARSLNCLVQRPDPCGSCEVCRSDSSFSPFYTELDSSVVGNVSSIKELKEELTYIPANTNYRVITFDEFHLAARAAQSTLLKTLEDLPSRIFVLICTTELDKIISTIRSRSIELQLFITAAQEISDTVLRIAEQESIEVSPAALEKIVSASGGHMRDAVMSLDLYRTSESEQAFLETLYSYEQILIYTLFFMREGDREKFRHGLLSLSSGVLEFVRRDLCVVMRNALEMLASDGEFTPVTYAADYKEFVGLWRNDLIRLFKTIMSPWTADVFDSDDKFQAFMWSLFCAFRKRDNVASTGSSMLSMSRKK